MLPGPIMKAMNGNTVFFKGVSHVKTLPCPKPACVSCNSNSNFFIFFLIIYKIILLITKLFTQIMNTVKCL